MQNNYLGVTTRFLRSDERQMLSQDPELPLVIEAKDSKDINYLQNFLTTYSTKIIEDMAKYGAVLLRGFAVNTDSDFENTVLSIKGLRGISEAFMSEQGRIHVDGLKYVMHTNAVYKTGGTLYLGGFHTENYYSPDVPSYISFCCLEPSSLGGETGLINAEKVYQELDNDLKARLEKHTYFVSKWLLTEVARRYQTSTEIIEKICQQFDLPIIGEGDERFILMYKPSVFEHPLTKKKALGLNLFEIPTLNAELRKIFANDYQGKTWFWHRNIWKLPAVAFKIIENIYITFASLFYSPKESFDILRTKFNFHKANKKKINIPNFNDTKVGSCFNDDEVKKLAQSMRNYYSSCLWKKGDILLVDNKKVMHAGMPGAGPRLIRAMIANPIEMQYSYQQDGNLICKERQVETVGYYASVGKVPGHAMSDKIPTE